MTQANVVVVGYGGWGRQCHCYLIARTPGLRLHGVVARKPENQERARTDYPDARIYDELEEALSDPQVDAVVLATPNHTHEAFAVQALRAGKHVVSDKVMCLSLAECDRMVGAANESGKILTVFQNRRWDGDFNTARSLIAGGDLGELRWVEMAWQGLGAWGGWRGQAQSGGGRFYDLGAHLIDQMLVLFSQPIETVYARIRHDFTQTDVDSEAFVLVTFQGGGTGVCDMSSLAALSKPRFYIRGTEGTYQKYGLDPQENAMKAGDIDAAVEEPETFGRLKTKTRDETVPTQVGRWRTYYELFADCLLQNGPLPVPLHEARRVIAVMDAAHRSAQTGSVIAAPDVETPQQTPAI